MRGAPQSGFSRLIVRISSRMSFGTAGRPRWPRRIFPAQNRRKPFRCQPITVAGWTRKTLDRQSFQTSHNQAHRNRSAGVSFGRFTERCRTPSWWRSARISSCSAARLRNEAKREAKSAENKSPKGNRRKTDKPQCTNQFGIDENHSQVLTIYQVAPFEICCRHRRVFRPVLTDPELSFMRDFLQVLCFDASLLSISIERRSLLISDLRLCRAFNVSLSVASNEDPVGLLPVWLVSTFICVTSPGLLRYCPSQAERSQSHVPHEY